MNAKLKNKKGSVRVSLAVAIWLIFPAANLFAQEKVDASYTPTIREVTLYPDRAMALRDARVQLAPGKHRLVFRGASPALDTSSLRAFSDSSDVIIQGISSHVERLSQTINPEIRELEKNVEALEKRAEILERSLKRARMDLDGIKRYYAYLAEAISEQSTSRSQGGNLEAWEKARAFLSQRRLATMKEIQRNDEALRILKEDLNVANAKLRKLKSSENKSVRIVSISLQAVKAKTAKVGFSYIIRGAAWTPSYGIYLSGQGKANLEVYGNIRQTTGENWKNVRLYLSTSRPALGSRRPLVTPLYVNGRVVSTKTVIATEDKKSSPGKGGGRTPGDTTGPSTLERRGLSLSFRIPEPVTIASGRRSQRIAVDNFQTELKDMSYRILGSRSLSAFLAARVQNKRSYPLLPGTVDIYRKSGFTGKSRIAYTPAGSSFTLGFGKDPGVKIKRRVYHYTESAGVFSSDEIYRTSIRLELNNPGDSTRKISVYERIPVSELSEVKVEMKSDTTAGYSEVKNGSGILRWNYTMAPGSRRIVILHYAVKAPKKYKRPIFGN